MHHATYLRGRRGEERKKKKKKALSKEKKKKERKPSVVRKHSNCVCFFFLSHAWARLVMSRRIQQINNRELELNVLSPDLSWHNEYREQAYIYIGNLHRQLTEADVLAVFSQYGVPVDLKLVRDRTTGDSKGFAFLKYEDQRSTILAIDNLNGANIAGQPIRVDHVLYNDANGNDSTTEYADAMRKELDKDRVMLLE